MKGLGGGRRIGWDGIGEDRIGLKVCGGETMYPMYWLVP